MVKATVKPVSILVVCGPFSRGEYTHEPRQQAGKIRRQAVWCRLFFRTLMLMCPFLDVYTWIMLMSLYFKIYILMAFYPKDEMQRHRG